MMLHLAEQMKFWGPLRSCWLYRYEGKNKVLKDMKTKCYRNIGLSLMKRCQLNVCYEMHACDYVVSRGDEIRNGHTVRICWEYEEVTEEFGAKINPLDDECYKTSAISTLGLEYRPGVNLLTDWEDRWPTFVEIVSLYVHGDTNFAVCRVLKTVQYVWMMNAYEVNDTENLTVVIFDHLVNKWPIPAYTVDSKKMIVNRYGHFAELGF